MLQINNEKNHPSQKKPFQTIKTEMAIFIRFADISMFLLHLS